MTNTAPLQITDKTSLNLTSYDLLKALAVLLMIIDHIGYYFYPEEMWLRVIGRFCVPIWFFLVGYARSRDLSPLIWIGAGILILASMGAGQPVFPLNVLGTMILIRLVIDPVMKATTRNAEAFMAFSVILLALALPTYYLTEYGTQGLLLAIFGYIVRHKPQIPGFGENISLINGFCMFTIFTFTGLQALTFGFNAPQFIVLGAGIAVVCLVLTGFRPVEFPKLTQSLPVFLVAPVQFLGRWTLEIYVAHLILFKILGVLSNPERFAFLQWTWFWAG